MSAQLWKCTKHCLMFPYSPKSTINRSLKRPHGSGSAFNHRLVYPHGPRNATNRRLTCPHSPKIAFNRPLIVRTAHGQLSCPQNPFFWTCGKEFGAPNSFSSLWMNEFCPPNSPIQPHSKGFGAPNSPSLLWMKEFCPPDLPIRSHGKGFVAPNSIRPPLDERILPAKSVHICSRQGVVRAGLVHFGRGLESAGGKVGLKSCRGGLLFRMEKMHVFFKCCFC